MSKGSRHKARLAAVQAIYQWEMTQEAPASIEDHYLGDHEMGEIDVDYFHYLVREVPLRVHELDDHIIPHLDRGIEEVDPVERAILRIGAYEFEFHPEVPYKVIINEAVELSKVFGAEHGHKYVNAILDKVAVDLRAAEVSESKNSSS